MSWCFFCLQFFFFFFLFTTFRKLLINSWLQAVYPLQALCRFRVGAHYHVMKTITFNIWQGRVRQKPVNHRFGSPGSSSWPLPPLAQLGGFLPSRRGVCTTPSLRTSRPSAGPAARGWWKSLPVEGEGEGGETEKMRSGLIKVRHWEKHCVFTHLNQSSS